MHFVLILLAVLIAYSIRMMGGDNQINSSPRWESNLFLFVFPPLLLIMTSIAIVSMGYHGEMWGIQASKISYLFAWLFLIFCLVNLVRLVHQNIVVNRRINRYLPIEIEGTRARLLDTSFPYAAQIGFWRSQLLVSSGLRELLPPQHLRAVLAHEEAHKNYRDPFFFFWLSYIKEISFWLPNNQILWDELLLLRELRADRKASEKVDYLLLAESLLMVTEACLKEAPKVNYSLMCPFTNYRLQERIEALLDYNDRLSSINWHQLGWIVLIFVPWIILPFHSYC